MSTTALSSEYMILIRQPNDGPGPGPEELKKIMERFALWMEGLAAKGMVVSTSGLDTTGVVLRGSSVTDGPFAEAKEIVGGYVHIQAESFEQAVEAARTCPELDYRLSLEVRPFKPR